VVIPQEALSLEKYVKAKRTGRGVRLDRKKRIEVWKVFDAYLSLMKEEQIRDINMAMYECSKMFANSGTKNKYAHIIVDEGQDFSDNATDCSEQLPEKKSLMIFSLLAILIREFTAIILHFLSAESMSEAEAAY
jgi:superfamily I DNA/RNA helicase